MNTIEKLLVDVSAVSAKYDLLNKKTGGYFNIFDIAGIAADELAICRVIHELLNPSGSHYQGDAYLRLFIKHVLQMQLTDEDYKTVRVYREYGANHERRIDLVIETENYLIPIEVKIYAGEQARQCYDYYQQAKNSKLFYLTLYGNSPSAYSASTLTKNEEGYDEVINVSFKHEVFLWLNKCLEHKETIRIAPIREIILQLIAVIRRMTDQLEEGMAVDIKSIIMSSKENMASAVEIEKSLKVCKTEMLWDVFRALEQGIEHELGLKKVVNVYDYAYNDGAKVVNYYDRKVSTYPGISYEYKSNVKEGIDLWLRVEIGWQLFAGFCVPFNGQALKQQLSPEEIKQLILHKEPKVSTWWAYWEYLPSDNKELSPDFKTLDVNDTYFNLFNKEYFDNFIKQCVTSIKDLYHGGNDSSLD